MCVHVQTCMLLDDQSTSESCSRQNKKVMFCPKPCRPPEPTRITVAPPDMDVAVGESVLLPCQARHDPLLRAVFTWYFNGTLEDVGGGGSHLEKVGGVSRAPSSCSLCVCGLGTRVWRGC